MKIFYRFSCCIIMVCLVHASNAQTPGSVRWGYLTEGSIESSPAIGSDGTVYVGSWDDHVYAINPNGTLKWRYDIGSNIEASPAIGPDGAIYIGSWNTQLYAFNDDGTLRWQFDTEGYITSSPAIGSDGTVYAGSWDQFLYALHMDGTLKWRYKTGRLIHGSPAIGSDGTIHVGSDDLYAINPDGTLKWKYEAGSKFEHSPAIGPEGTLFADAGFSMYAINTDGTLKWTFQAQDYIRSSPAIGSDGAVYFGSDADVLYAVNPDGTLRWTFQTQDNIRSSPTIGIDGTVYIGSNDYSFYAIDPDGNKKWQVYTGDDVKSSAAIDENGTIYVGSDDNNLYAINSSSKGLGVSSWPKLYQNNQNTCAFPIVYIVDQIAFNFFQSGETIQDTFTVLNSTSKNVVLNNCTFNHAGFSLFSTLPITLLPKSERELKTSIHPVNTGLYRSICKIDYEIDGVTNSASTQIQDGLFLEDGSETALTAHRALAAYNNCLSEDPNSAAVKNNMGVLYRLLGEPSLAERAFMAALSRGQNNLHGYSGIKMNVGVVKSDQNSPAEARQYFDVAMTDVVDGEVESVLVPQIHYNKAWEAYTQNDLDSAEAFINKTIVHAKANDFLKAKAYVLRGAINYQREDDPSATSDFQQAVILDPDGPIGQMAQDNLDAMGTGIHEINAGLPCEYVLLPNYPNPFNSETTVSFGLPIESDLTIGIYNLRGQRIRTLLTSRLHAGWQQVIWNGLDDTGSQVGSGVYLLKMKAGEFESTHKMTLLK